MTVQVSNIEEYVSYLTDSLVVPPRVVVGEPCVCYFYNTEGVEWVGSDTRPIIYLSCSFTEVTDTTTYAIVQSGVVGITFSPTVSNGAIGQWNDVVKSTNHTKPNCVMWESSYSQTGTYDVIVSFRKGSTNYNVTRSVEVISKVIATATTTVKNGISITQSTLTFENGHSMSDFVAGQTYQITARYLENDGYEGSVGIGELEILRHPTTTTISGSSSVTVGENLTLSIVVKENNNNTTLTTGYITVYDGTDIVQQNYAITGNSTQITFTPSTIGTHNIYAIFTDNGTTYNTSRSNTLTVIITNQINIVTTLPNDSTCHVIDNYPIQIKVTNSKNEPVQSEVIKLYLNSETKANLMGQITTDTNGEGTLTWNANPPTIMPGTYTVITKHEANAVYEAKTVTNTLKVVKRTRQFSVTSGDSVTVKHDYLLEGGLTYTTHFTNYTVLCNNHDITIDTEGLIQQPLLLDDWIQADLLTTSVTTNVAPYMNQGSLNVGQKGTVYYKYPITVESGLNVTFEFKLLLNTGANEGRLALIRLDENGNRVGFYDYWLPKATYGENPTFRIRIVDNILTLTCIDTGTLIRERELNTEGCNTYYIAFNSAQDGKVIIESMSNTLQALTCYNIQTLDNWYHDTYPGVDETTQQVKDAYVIGILRQYDKGSHPFKLEEFVSTHTSNFTTEMSLNNGSLYCGVGTYVRLKNLVSGTQEYFKGDFRVECDIEERDGSHYTIYLNTPSNESGSIQLNKYTNGSNGIQERDTSGTISKSTGLSAHPFTNTTQPRNKLTIQRLNGVVTISFTDTNDNDYTYTAEQNLGNGRCNFAFYGYADGSLNVHSVTVKSIDSNTSNIEEAYVGVNGYVFQGQRKGFVLKRPIDITKDKYVKVETYQKEVWMRVGFTTLNNNNVINTNKYQYTYVNQIGIATANLSNFSVFTYEFRVQPDGSIKSFINGQYTKTITFGSGETLYLCIYASSQNDYVKEVVLRQDTIRLKTTNGTWSTPIKTAMVGEYLFKFTVETTDAYYGLHREKNLFSLDK